MYIKQQYLPCIYESLLSHIARYNEIIRDYQDFDVSEVERLRNNCIEVLDVIQEGIKRNDIKHIKVGYIKD